MVINLSELFPNMVIRIEWKKSFIFYLFFFLSKIALREKERGQNDWWIRDVSQKKTCRDRQWRTYNYSHIDFLPQCYEIDSNFDEIVGRFHLMNVCLLYLTLCVHSIAFQFAKL